MNHPKFYIAKRPDDSRSRIPSVLYRRFTCREHAENFVKNGEIRFRSLSHFRSLEADEVRRDGLEGSIEVDMAGATIEIAPVDTEDYGSPLVLTSGTMRIFLTMPDPFFISCYSYRKHPAQRKFGRFLVEIYRPKELIGGIILGPHVPEELFWGKVRYFNRKNPADAREDRQLWLSKPDSLRFEFEFRLALLVHGHDAGNAQRATCRLVLGDISDIARITED